MHAKAVRAVGYRAMQLHQMLFHQADTERIVNHPVCAGFAFRLNIHRNTDFREEPLYIAVVIANIGGNVINRLRQNLIIIAIRIKAPLRIHVVFEIELRGEIVQRIVAFARLHPARNVIVNAEKIDARSGNQLHVGFCHLRQAVVRGQNFAQRFRELMLHQRIEEAAVEEQIRIPRRFLVFRAVVAGIGRRQIQHHANLAFQRQRAKLAHRFGVGQHNVERHLRRQPAVFLAGIVEVVQVAALNRHNRLVEGNPVFHLVTE